MSYQNISQEITQAHYDAFVAKLNELKALFTFFINLTEEERQTLPKMGNSKLPFVIKALNYAEANPTLAPGYMNVPELRKDLQLNTRVLAMLQLLRPYLDSMDDTGLAVGSEAYVTSLAFYNSVGQAAKLNVAGASAIYADLTTHFEQSSTPPTPPPPNP